MQRFAVAVVMAACAGLASPLQGEETEARRSQANPIDSDTPPRLSRAAGDAEEAMKLGLKYDIGHGVGQDPALAYHWYHQAAEEGLPAAAFNVAAMLSYGIGIAPDHIAAALWYARAAAAGHHRAQFVLAQLYAEGDGVPRNPSASQAWYRAAARGGLPAAASHFPAPVAVGRAAAASADDALVQPTPMAPVDAALPGGRNLSKVALVWNAPEQAVPVQYYFELRAVDDSGSHEIASGYVETTAALVELPGGSGRYAWRVYAVGRAGSHYASSAWNAFSIDKVAVN